MTSLKFFVELQIKLDTNQNILQPHDLAVIISGVGEACQGLGSRARVMNRAQKWQPFPREGRSLEHGASGCL